MIKHIVETEKERQLADEYATRFIAEQRIPAEYEIIMKGQSSVFDIIRHSSANAGLVFMGMRPPEAEESIEEYSRYYGNLIETTQGLPPLALVLAAEDIEFRKVIGISQMD